MGGTHLTGTQTFGGMSMMNRMTTEMQAKMAEMQRKYVQKKTAGRGLSTATESAAGASD